jgi:hypothetical protein
VNLITVIISVSGDESELIRCINSLESLRPFQLILSGTTVGQLVLERAHELASEVIYEQKVVSFEQGIPKASGEWILFLSSRITLSSHYREECHKFLLDKDVQIAGGPMLSAKGMNGKAMAWAIAMSSPLCSGPTFARYKSLGKRRVRTDDEKLSLEHLWVRRSILQNKILPERPELSELVKWGTAFYFPSLIVYKLWQRLFSAPLVDAYHAGRERALRPGEVFWLPSIFVLLHLLLWADPVSFWSLGQLYLAIIISVSIGLSVRYKKIWLFPMVAFLHYTIVFSYGVGFLRGKFPAKR